MSGLEFVPEVPSPVRSDGAVRSDRGAPAKWTAEANELRARPGEWAVLQRGPSNGVLRVRAAHITRGRVKAFVPAGAFEAKSRKQGTETVLYVRYVGDPS